MWNSEELVGSQGRAIDTASGPQTMAMWAALFGLGVLSCGAAAPASGDDENLGSAQQALVSVDARRSLVATEKVILARFPFKRVMDALVAQSGVSGLTSLQLFQSWWNTQNPAPLGSCTATLNSYPYECRPSPSEGVQAGLDPFAEPLDSNPNAYLPVGVFMRPDLARKTTKSCGEYRIVYARRAGVTDARQRNLIIFEGYLPNPRADGLLKGCKALAQRMADLSLDDATTRANKLEQAFFEGFGAYSRVVDVTHYGANPSSLGQVRTNQFIDGPTWNLREFKLRRTCGASGCTALTFEPVTVKNNAFGPLFGAVANHPRVAAFQGLDWTKLATRLSQPTFSSLRLNTPDQFNSGQALASGSDENRYTVQFASAPPAFRSALEAGIVAAGASLTAEQVVLRAQTFSCAGCHRLNNNLDVGGGIIWPASTGFTHVDERTTEVGPEGLERFPLSPALVNKLLPERKQLLEAFLAAANPEPSEPGATYGGHETH